MGERMIRAPSIIALIFAWRYHLRRQSLQLCRTGRQSSPVLGGEGNVGRALAIPFDPKESVAFWNRLWVHSFPLQWLLVLLVIVCRAAGLQMPEEDGDGESRQLGACVPGSN